MKKKRPASLRLAACALSALLLSGCAALLERSYSVEEPYADRYWDSSAEDTLRAESYQDLVNSLLLLIEQRAEEGIIRCYGEIGNRTEALAAREEIRRETMLGSYLLQNITMSFEENSSYTTLTCKMSYREDAEDIASIMTLSDSQSLVDLLRLSVREEREKLTAHFAYDTPQEDVTAAVESLWQELCRSEMEQNAVPAVFPPDGPAIQPEDETPPSDSDVPPPNEGAPEAEPEAQIEPGEPDILPVDGGIEDPDGELPPEEPPPEEPPPEEDQPEEIIYPPCPWVTRFYPNPEAVEKIVEVILRK